MSLLKRFSDRATQGMKGTERARPRSKLRERGNDPSDGEYEPLKARRGEIENANNANLCANVLTYVPMC